MTDYQSVAVEAARLGGARVLSEYRKTHEIEFKQDGSPLTRADRLSHEAITEVLAQAGLPIVSEEGLHLSLDARLYWLVDPLDGTKDFIAGNDEFTVNIALVADGFPVLGVLYAPALGELYYGSSTEGFWCDPRGPGDLIGKPEYIEGGIRMATSRFHDGVESRKFAEFNRIHRQVPIGSALKFGRLAIGAVDVYPRFVGTSEWDTAAGQAVLEAAGGQVIDLSSGGRMRYGKRGRRNGSFLALRAPLSFSNFKLEYE